MERLSDGVLVCRARNGDADAFTEVVRRYQDRAYATAYCCLGHREDAQDATQDTFVLAYRCLAQLRDPAKFGPWLRRLILNACAEHRRRHYVRVLSLDNGVDIASPPDDDRHALRMSIWEALQRLPENGRLVLILSYIGGYSHAEIAQYMEIPLNTVRSRLQTAKRSLRQELGDMITDMLNDDKPDDAWTKALVERAIQEGDDARKAFEGNRAIEHYRAAVNAAETHNTQNDVKRLQIDALRKQAEASWHSRPWDETHALLIKALELAESLEDRCPKAKVLYDLARGSAGDKAITYFHQSLLLFQSIGDAIGQGECLLPLAMMATIERNFAQSEEYVRSALPLFTESNSKSWEAVCRAFLRTLSDLQTSGNCAVLRWTATCDVWEATDFRLRFTSSPGFAVTNAGVPSVAKMWSMTWHMSRAGGYLDPPSSSEAYHVSASHSYTGNPLTSHVTVLSTSENIECPAGSFANCILTEQITEQTLHDGSATELAERLNLQMCCGVVRTWYALGVGIVRVQVEPTEGDDNTIELESYSVSSENVNSYFPCAIGNTWTYGWKGVSEEFRASEHYHIMDHVDDRWYVEAWGVVTKQPGLPDCLPLENGV